MDDLLYQINCLSVLQLALASVAYYLSFIPIFFALIGALAVGNYFGGRWLFKANERGNGKMIIPLGLSYLVFTVISYHIGIKRKNIKPERHFGYFSLYLLFFPRIAQGPIERPQKLIPQLREIHAFDYDMVTGGMKFILMNYFNKHLP
jgi:D-alanyl-lipoteichoic acid acyltransferase DltB (MBOAT superfamily)